VQNPQHTSSEQPVWWAVYTRHQHEKVIADALTAKGFEVFLPLYQSVSRWKDRRKTLSLPLFPCYLFIRGGLVRRLPVVTTPGVLMVLSRGDQVAIIPDSEIEALRRVIDGFRNVAPHPFLHCGDRVRVTRGPLTGIEGILTRKKNLLRLVLSVEMLAQSVAVEIDTTDVEPVSKNRPGASLSPSQLAFSDATTNIPKQPPDCFPYPHGGSQLKQESL
jgi:transcription antitermination factor NusG